MRTHSKTPLFLMELIIMLLVFSISAAVCLQVFAGAKRISAESSRLDTAVIQAQNAAECWKATKGDIAETAEMFGSETDGNSFSVYDEENWIHMEFTCEGPKADIIIMNGEKEIFSLTSEVVMIDG